MASASTMPAVRYSGPGSLRLETVATPSVGAGEVLVQVRAAALCHTELHFIEGTLNLGVSPITMGHEAAGVIVSTGAGVGTERIGERVIVYYYVGCATCRWCLQGDEQICPSLKAEFGFISDGGLARYLKAPSRNCVVIPDSLSFELAAPIGCAVTTAVHAAGLAKPQPRETAVVYGVNGVGFGLVQLLKHRGLKVSSDVAYRQRIRLVSQTHTHATRTHSQFFCWIRLVWLGPHPSNPNS